MEILLLISIFISCFLFLLALSPNRNKKQDEGSKEEKQASLLGLLKSGNDGLRKLVTRKKKTGEKQNTIAEQLSIAGIPMRSEEFIVFRWMIAIIVAGILHLLISNGILSLAGFLLGYLLPVFWLKQRQQKRIKAFNEALPNTITSIVGSLRAGFSFLQALQMVAEESYGPMKEETQLLLRSMQYGTSMENALTEWMRRVPSEDLKLMVDAILIQRQVGGNLAYLLEKIVETIRERTRIENQIRTLTAQGRLSGIIIGLLPVVLGFLIYLMNPEYMGGLFTNPIGQLMLVMAVISGIIGFFFVRKITTIEV